MNLRPFLLLLVSTASLASAPAAAQEAPTAEKTTLQPLKLRHRLSFSYGDGISLREGAMCYQFPGMLPSYDYDVNRLTTAGSFNLDYLYMTRSGRWGFGANVGLTPVTYWSKWGSSQSRLLLTVAPRVQCTYLRSGLVELYGTASVGILLNASALMNNFCALAWQLDPIALRVGTERIAGFVSMGWGSRGIVGVGVQIGL